MTHVPSDVMWISISLTRFFSNVRRIYVFIPRINSDVILAPDSFTRICSVFIWVSVSIKFIFDVIDTAVSMSRVYCYIIWSSCSPPNLFPSRCIWVPLFLFIPLPTFSPSPYTFIFIFLPPFLPVVWFN